MCNSVQKINVYIQSALYENVS